MLKKCAILGLALLLIGGLSQAWLRKQADAEREETSATATGDTLQSADYLQKYGQWYRLTAEQQNRLVLELDEDRKNKTPEELMAEQRARLRADLPRLAAGEMNPGDIADYLYGRNWEDDVLQYRQRREQEQIAQTTSVVCLSIGGALFGICLTIWVLWSVVRAFKALAKRRTDRSGSIDSDPTELTDILHEDDIDENDDPEESLEDSDAALDEPGPALSPTWCEPNPSDRDQGERFLVPRRHRDLPPGRPTLAIEPRPQEDAAVAVLMSDEPSGEQEWSPLMEWTTPTDEEDPAETTPQKQRFTPRPRVAVLGATEIVSAPPPAAAAVTESPLTEQAEDLQRQIAEFKQMAQSVQQASREQSEPLGNTLKELAQQVSAIREYAACQQNRVEKLQDGYDWSIIRTFCLRVIRCIDNLENRIDKLGEDDEGALQLEEVRDELLFALESSGVEQYRPDVGSDYRGQEKFAEAVKEKESAPQPSQVGAIAKVVRPGYRYITDEDSYKVVRTAQVKLFG
ncbi:nucleotide exchange factor GrpE [Anaerobaca lacustris]|uniref:Nucleotide exchange factor GrpE n=1 Tax=Anaerobaca lacustris TaxID=3044600 RepID=A0AAW6U147_9BACT|nr:nucleotide exchange factor GrpE [Sedimentisphaerales bacterium M17dextr]